MSEISKDTPREPNAPEQWRPKILAFCCNWCTYAGADLAGLNRMNYPADIRLLVIPGRIQHVPEAILHLHIIPHMPFPGAIAFQRSARYQHRRYSKTAT